MDGPPVWAFASLSSDVIQHLKGVAKSHGVQTLSSLLIAAFELVLGDLVTREGFDQSDIGIVPSIRVNFRDPSQGHARLTSSYHSGISHNHSTSAAISFWSNTIDISKILHDQSLMDMARQGFPLPRKGSNVGRTVKECTRLAWVLHSVFRLHKSHICAIISECGRHDLDPKCNGRQQSADERHTHGNGGWIESDRDISRGLGVQQTA